MSMIIPTAGRNVTSTNTAEAATIRQPEEHPGLLMARPPPYLLIPPEGVHSSPIPQMLCIPPQDL